MESFVVYYVRSLNIVWKNKKQGGFMKKLFLMRHGDYENPDKLSFEGRDAIQKSAIEIEGSLSPMDEKIFIASSPIGRAFESAEILSSVFGVFAEKWEELAFDEFNEIWSKITEIHDKFDVVILMTHEFVVGEGYLFFLEKIKKEFFPKKLIRGKRMRGEKASFIGIAYE